MNTTARNGMEANEQGELRRVLESVWLKALMLHAPIDDVTTDLIDEGTEGAYALGIGLRALYRSLRHDCMRLDELFNLRDGALSWSGELVAPFDTADGGGEHGARDAARSMMANPDGKAAAPRPERMRTA